MPDDAETLKTFTPVSGGDGMFLNNFLNQGFWEPDSPPLATAKTFNPGVIEIPEITSDAPVFSRSSFEMAGEVFETPFIKPSDTVVDNNTTSDFCMGTTLATLRDLYNNQLMIAHQSLSDRNMNLSDPTSDQVLKTNRLAVQKLNQILSCACDTCSYDPNMPFLIATITSKILRWYKAVYTGDIIKLPTPTQNSRFEEKVANTSITVGSFTLDPVAEARMKAQLLLCELQNLKKVIDVFSQQNKARSVEISSVEGSVYEAFEQFLLSSLNDLVGKLSSHCVSRG
ncbi:MAG: hypothetical protein Q9190_001167 [Brigantiaea leucoxantha]